MQWLYRAHAGNLLSPVRQLSSNSRRARMSFSQVQLVFIVEHYLASRSYLTCQNEFRDILPDSPVPNKSTISRLVNRFHDREACRTETVQTREKEWMHAFLNAVDISNTYIALLVVVWFQWNITTLYFMVALGLLAESKIGSFGGGW
jgi:hypothetical protein